MRFTKYLLEQITVTDLKTLKKYVDKFFKSLDIDVQFTRHFLDRVNDKRNKPEINIGELKRLFNKTYKQHGREIKKLPDGTQAVIRDMITDVNMPFVFEWDKDSKEFDLVPKSVLRKKGFTTQNKTFDLKGEMLP